MQSSRFVGSMAVAEILKRYPQVIPVFLHHNMSCVGCSMSLFESLSDAAAIYHLSYDSFIAELEKVASEGNPARLENK